MSSLPVGYRFTIPLSELDNDEYTFISNSQDIEFYLDFVGFNESDLLNPYTLKDTQFNIYHSVITGIVVCQYDGDLYAMWLTESNQPDDLRVDYHPLPYYKPDRLINQPHLPVYWNEDNLYYRR